MQSPDGSFARPGATSPTVLRGRSREEIIAVDRRISMSLPDKRPISRRGPIHGDGRNINHGELSKYGSRPSTAVSTQANCGNTLDLMKFLDSQHEPMHRSAPYRIVVGLVASGRKRLRLLEDSKPKIRRKLDAGAKDDHHRQIEKPRSRIWSSISKAKKKRACSGNAESQPKTVHNDEQADNPHRRKWIVSGTRNRRNSKVIECEDRDFLYPGVGKLPSLPSENEKTAADNNSCTRQSRVVSPHSQEPRTSGDAFWQPETIHDNPNQTDTKKDVERAEDSTAAPLATVSNILGEDQSFLALKYSGANSACGVSTTPNTCQDRILAVGGGSESFPENKNKTKRKNNNTPEGALPLQHQPCTGQTTASGSSSITPFSQLQPSDCRTASNNTSPAPRFSDFSPTLTPALTALGYETDTKKNKPPACLPSDSAHIDLQCLPPRSSSKEACRSPSIFAAFTHHRRRSSYSKSLAYPLAPAARSSTDTQSLISLFPRPARFPDASHSAASMPSLEQMQPLHAVTTTTPNHLGIASSNGYRRSSKGPPLAASPLHRETSPDVTAVQASVAIPHPQTTDNSRHTLAQTKTTNLQDHFIFAAPGERQFTERNAGRRLSPKASLESKKLRCLGISDPSKMDTTKPLEKMSRAERVFVLRMRDMCLARGGLKKDTQQPIPSEGSTPEEVRRGWELQTDSKQPEDKPTDMSITPPKARRNDAPGSPPRIPLPADPPVPSLRSPSNKIVFSPNQFTSQPQSTLSLDAAIVHKAEACLPASSSGSTHRSNSNKSWSSRSARSGNDIPQQNHATNAEHHTSSSQHGGLGEKNAIARGLPPLTPLPPPMPDEAHTGILVDCGNCGSCSHLRTNPSPTNKNRKNTFFYKENRSDPRINNSQVPQSPLRECFPRDSSCPNTPSPPHNSNNNTYSNRNSAGNNKTHATSSPQSSSTRPRSQDTSTHPQYEARIAFLERQNKMLQAALIAALDVGVTFDADLMRSVTSTPPISIASPGSETNNKDSFRLSYASTATTGTTRTTTSTQRLSMDGRRSYIRDRSVEPATNVARSRSVRDARTRQYVGDSSYQGHTEERKLVSS
ncbi:hypothetical protein EMCG_07288 [[Emmonsia] crescens]|uniref:Uncharacterized protein n=1 Tax=[Emmonsia] crescens TaxID=73230 RepID=A0A0G2J5T1_9EURO|nr:hypothetical protein EMCG_07288 [Emmonsia crescens UAMH 3008]